MTKDEARITIEGVPDRPGISHEIFSKIAAENIPVDMIVQNVGEEGRADISFTVLKNELPATLAAIEPAARDLGGAQVTHDDGVAKVSIVGLGMATQTGVADRMFRALADAAINILMITTSEIKLSVLVARDQALDALRVLHRVFELDQPPAPAVKPSCVPSESRTAGANAVDVVARLQGMEDLTIETIDLDDSQGRITIRGVPDQPGLAAKVFEEVAANHIFVDMIVQSMGRDGRASLSFTVPQAQMESSQKVGARLAQELGCGPVTSSPKVAKLSVSGIGMRSHTGVGIRMFRSLSDAGINVEMINTSEVRVNVVVDGDKGSQGLAALQDAFQDVMH